MSDISKIFYVNLARRTDRRDFMEEQLDGLGIDYERFDAVEPSIQSLLSPEGEHHEFFLRATPRFKSFVQTPRLRKRAIGVFGVYISHYRIHQRMAAEDPRNYVILEDDCRVTSESLSRVRAALRDGAVPDDWDIVRSCWKSTEDVETFRTSHHESLYSSATASHDIYGGAHFSLFRGTSARRVLDHLDGDCVLAIDAAYSTHRLNVYHSKFGISLAPMGTDIPKLSTDPFHIRALRKARRVSKRFF